MSERPTRKVWTQLAGYALVRLVSEPDRIALILEPPPGKAPYRIRLHKPKSLESPRDFPAGGLAITSVEMSGLGSGTESVAVQFADGQELKGISEQIVVDVS